jgi:hypothetical protein
MFSVGILAALTGCGSGANSQLQSLDAFSAGLSAEGQRCSAAGITAANLATHAYSDSEVQDKILVAHGLSADRQSQLKKLATLALTAVPRQLVRLFLASGDIRITPDAAAICSTRTDKVQTRGVAGCFVALTENNIQKLSIVANATKAAVGGTIVRSFGYWVSQHLATLGEADGKTYKTSAPNAAFVANQRQVAREYFEDVDARGLFDLSRFESLLGKGAAGKIAANIKDAKPDPLSGVTFNVERPGSSRDERRARFESYIFAEAFDSFFCNTHAAHPAGQTYNRGNLKARLSSLRNTNKVFRDLFPATYQVFSSVIAGMLTEVSAYLKDKSAGRAGLMLADDATDAPLVATMDSPVTAPAGDSTPVAQPVTSTETSAPPATTASTPATTPVVTGEPPKANPDALTVIIDAQGQSINENNIQVIQPAGGLEQDLNIEIINQGPGPQQPGQLDVQVGGLQPGNGSGLDSSIVTPVTVNGQPPMTTAQPESTTPPETSTPPVTQPEASTPPVSPVQQPVTPQQPVFPPQTGQVSQGGFPQPQSWPGYDGGGGYYGGGGYGGYGGCH